LNALSTRTRSSTISLDIFQPDTLKYPPVSSYYGGHPLQEYTLPELPQITEGELATAPFIHNSSVTTDRTTSTGLTYERLEFLGDAYIEIIATRIIFSRYAHLAAGRQVQIREQLVKNETLLGFSLAYGFRERLQAAGKHITDEITKGNKGPGKILADVFEAYVAAVVLSDPELGFQRVEIWLTELWAPLLLRHYGPGLQTPLLAEYNPNGKMELQKKVGGIGVKLEYLHEKPMEQSKHSQKYFIAVYLTGHGYEKQRLGYGEGVNQTEAGNRAAVEAMTKNEAVCIAVEAKVAALRKQRAAERELEAAEKKVKD